MKLTWDNIDNIYLSRYGNFVLNNTTYYLSDKPCKICGELYLTNRLDNSNIFCSKSCVFKDSSRNPAKVRSKNYISKISKATIKRFSKKSNHPRWKGGVNKSNLPLYATYNKQLIIDNTSKIKVDGLALLQVVCTYCNKWFIPKTHNVRNRVVAINRDPTTRGFGESRFYCSSGCKKACPIFGMRKYERGVKSTTSREVQPSLRKLVLERDNWTCQKCSGVDIELHCHHIDPVINNPIESADVDNCITLCKTCHIEIHKLNKNCINKC